ncbi:MAG TPA: NACHT domain-containing protein [Candidatus Dormibacteraeota bacterium]|nr:NACHT domain-containing protein [Candidatus Dormibacteraeota bacterium]
MSVEAVVLTLGAAVVKSACKLWLGDRAIAGDVSASAVDLIVGQVSGELRRRRARRLFEGMEEVVAERLSPLLEHEYRALAEHERAAALEAVRETFERAALTDADLFAADLDSAYLDRHVRRHAPEQPRRWGLSQAATSLYERLLRECCTDVIEITRTLPRFGPAALTEVLRREARILDDLREVLERLPRRGVGDFEAQYGQHVISVLDRVELFGAAVTEASSRYPLSVAYISVRMASSEADAPAWRRLAGQGGDDDALTVSADAALDAERLFIRGEAGSGKTTLLQWIAVRCAARDRPGRPDLVPFLVRLRHYAGRDLPTPERFLEDVGRHISDEMPPQWVHGLLRAGRAIVLIDGVDELPEDRRHQTRSWLRELVTTFPRSRYVVTSRPAAVDASWLVGEAFTAAELLPMGPSDVRAFVGRWHQAVGEQLAEAEERARLADYERQLVSAIEANRHLANLASNPLLCALVCALHRDRRARLPDSSMELYQVALQMLLERRDRERGIPAAIRLSLGQKTLLLQDLALWLLQNEWSDAERGRAVRRLRRTLATIPQVKLDADAACRHLVERTGVLREPVVGRVDFVHRTFQEYLAAKAAIEDDQVGYLVAHAHLDHWRDVVPMAAGHAQRRQRTELLRGLVERGDRDRRRRDALHLVAAASLGTSPAVDAALRREIERRTAALLPPATMEAARSLIRAGEFVLDLLAAARIPETEAEVAATIRAAAAIGGDQALRIIARHRSDRRHRVELELVGAWPRFDLERYAAEVLRERELLSISDPALVPALGHLLALRRLACVFHNGHGDLGFVTGLRLQALTVVDPLLDDLTPLAGLRELTFLRLVTAPESVIDLRPLAGVPGLRIVVNPSQPVLGAQLLGAGSTVTSR